MRLVNQVRLKNAFRVFSTSSGENNKNATLSARKTTASALNSTGMNPQIDVSLMFSIDAKSLLEVC